ncbi:hypothetical protein BC827DRAFT_1157776 [Russula dissimulans]|nr:hypothetical protein BC827DRAFT_1157776 [Russula dissimulans]
MAIEAKARQNFIENNNGGVGWLRNDSRGSCEAVRRRRVGPEVRAIPKTRVEQAHSSQVMPIKSQTHSQGGGHKAQGCEASGSGVEAVCRGAGRSRNGNVGAPAFGRSNELTRFEPNAHAHLTSDDERFEVNSETPTAPLTKVVRCEKYRARKVSWQVKKGVGTPGRRIRTRRLVRGGVG